MKTTNPKATKTVYPIICQIVNVIPHQFIAETAKAHKMQSRTFTPKSHVAAMLYCQVSKTESLNSICDVAAANEALWTSMGVTNTPTWGEDIPAGGRPTGSRDGEEPTEIRAQDQR